MSILARRLPLDAARMAVVRHGRELVDAAGTATRTEARARFALPDGPVVLVAGRLSVASGIGLLVDAFIEWRRTAPTAQLLVVGADHGALAALRARVAATGVDAAVHLAGHLTGRDLRLAYAAADLFAAPGRTNSGDSAPVIDALASGLPVLGDASEVMRAAALAAVVHPGTTGVGRVPLARVDAWTDALQQTWQDLSARPALRDTARQVASQFGWMAAAEATERAYARALPVRP